MKIVQLTATNIKRLTAVEVTPDGAVVVISGRNGQGKTSVLDAIWMALGGKAGMKGTTRPVRDGATKGDITLDLGDLTVTRTFNGNGPGTLKVTAADGSRLTSPQKVLDDLVGQLSFDPLAFAHAAPKDQLATLLDVVDLPFDPAALDAERQAAYAARTEVNREAKALAAQVDAIGEPAPDLPDAEVSVAALAAEHRQASDDAQVRRLHVEQVARAAAAVADLEQRLDEARALVSDLEHRDLPPNPDLNEIEARMEAAEATNADVRAAADRAALVAQHEDATARSKALSERIAEVDQRKATGIAAAAMPIDGLGFDDDGVTYKGVPFAQCSGAEQLRVSLAMAMALNPTLRVVRITDGSLLDADGMALVAEMAEAHDFQVWVERVAAGEPVGVVIEDGAVAQVVQTADDDPAATLGPGSIFEAAS